MNEEVASSSGAPAQFQSELFTQVNWYALYTRSRHEKSVDEFLRRKRIETFLPLRKIRRKWSDRIKQIEEPLFKGYLFVHTAYKDRLEILRTKGVVRFVGFGLFPSIVPEASLFALKRFIEEDMEVDPFPYLREGDPVVVCSGPFRGVEGFLTYRKGKYRLVISLDLIEQSASIEIDAACVEKVQ